MSELSLLKQIRDILLAGGGLGAAVSLLQRLEHKQSSLSGTVGISGDALTVLENIDSDTDDLSSLPDIHSTLQWIYFQYNSLVIQEDSFVADTTANDNRTISISPSSLTQYGPCRPKAVYVYAYDVTGSAWVQLTGIATADLRFKISLYNGASWDALDTNYVKSYGNIDGTVGPNNECAYWIDLTNPAVADAEDLEIYSSTYSGLGIWQFLELYFPLQGVVTDGHTIDLQVATWFTSQRRRST
jgi:hypothetical protein